ncbi:MAG: exodeoxyribonuclease VII small subunit [Christensenellales bacterium]
MATKQPEQGFEQKLESLEDLVKMMEEGGMPLAQLMQSFQEGMRLADALKKELDAAQAKLLVLKNGALEDGGDADALP